MKMLVRKFDTEEEANMVAVGLNEAAGIKATVEPYVEDPDNLEFHVWMKVTEDGKEALLVDSEFDRAIEFTNGVMWACQYMNGDTVVLEERPAKGKR